MCGICGILALDETKGPVSVKDIRGIASLMARRGPDADGAWSDGRYCAFGFKRLAILDLSSNADQPMLSSDQKYALVYNGELYNFRELKAQLESRGFHFKSTGDTEVVLYSLACWGVEALKKFNGMFALAFYDIENKRLILARDHAGIKPLYYMLTPQGIVFASQYNQLLSHQWSKDQGVCEEAFCLYLHLGYIPAPYALLRNTHMLEPGSWLEVGINSSVKRGRFFEFPVYNEPTLKGEEAVELLNEAVTGAVKRQLISDVPVGTFLSGGIDSPLVTAKAQQASNGRIKAFTIGTNGDRFDESPDACVYASQIGIDHKVEHVNVGQLPDLLEDVAMACGEPFADYSIFPTMIISKVARQEVKVMLSGDGGDELLWGYYGRFASVLQLARHFRQTHLMRSFRWGIKKISGIGEVTSNVRWPTIGDWYMAKHSRIPEYWLKKIFQDLPTRPGDFSLFDYSGWKLDNTAQWLRWNELVGHLSMILLKVDRASMYNSLEVRVPLLDREVIDVAMRIDWQSCLDLKNKVGKVPLRRALSRHLHHQTIEKRGFEVPMGEWLRGPLRTVFEEKVFPRKELLGQPVNTHSIRAIFKRHLEGGVDYGRALWVLLSLVLWQEQHYQKHW